MGIVSFAGFLPLENRVSLLPEANLLARGACVGLFAFLGFLGGLLACFCKPLIAIGSCVPSWALWLCNLARFGPVLFGFCGGGARQSQPG